MRFLRLRTAVIVVLAVMLTAAGALLGGGWYYSDEIKSGTLKVDRSESWLDLVVAAIGEGRVTLRTTPETDRDGDWKAEGTWGLEHEDGYGGVGAIMELTARQVVREYFPLTGGLAVGAPVRLESYAFPGDPLAAHGLTFEEVSYSSPLGSFPAWLVAGSSDTWAIFVHGRGASRREALRLLPTLADLGLPCLVITYRNDVDVPANPDGFHWFGLTEWEDLEGAARYALEQGADDLVLIGYSMGGAIVTSFLYQSPLADKVRGAVLDSPLLDLGAAVDHGASRRRLPVIGLPIPGVLTDVAKAVAGLRFGISYEDTDYVGRAERLSVATLLLHGEEDRKAPVETSDRLARARPDIVEYVRVAEVGHVRIWNRDRAAYEATVAGFLRGLMQ